MTIDSAVVLAAGEGKRLRPLTKYRPKPMLPAANRPILEYVLDALVNVGVEELHLVVGYHRKRVQNHFGPTYRDKPITYHIQEKQLGSGHALLQAEGDIDEDFLVVNGDEVLDDSMVKAVVDEHGADSVGTLAVIESEEAPMYGAVRLQGDRIVEFTEKPRQGDYRLLNAGIYAFDNEFFDIVEDTPRAEGELSLPETLGRAMDLGKSIQAVRTEGLRVEATYPWDLTELASALLYEGIINEPEVDAGVYVAESAAIDPDATLRAPVVIGPDAVVGPGAVVGPEVALGRNTTVEANATIGRSVVDDDSRIGSNVAIFDSVTGQGADINVGVTVPHGPADVQVGTRIHEGEPLGCVVGDRATLGGGVSVTPGALIGPDATIGAGAHVRGNIDAGSEVSR